LTEIARASLYVCEKYKLLERENYCFEVVDTHYQDPLVGLSLTTKSYVEVSSSLHQLAHNVSNGRYLLFGAEGMSPAMFPDVGR